MVGELGITADVLFAVKFATIGVYGVTLTHAICVEMLFAYVPFTPCLILKFPPENEAVALRDVENVTTVLLPGRIP